MDCSDKYCGCETQNPICTENFCVTGEVFPRSEIGDREFSEVDVDDSRLLAALAGFSVPLLIGGVYLTGGTTGSTITYSVFAPGVVVGASQFYPISPRSDRFLGKSPTYVSAYVDAYKSEVI